MPRDTSSVVPSTAAGASAAVAPTDPADLHGLTAGLDRLQTDDEYSGGRWRTLARGVLPPVVFVAALIVLWQLVVTVTRPRPDVTPGPLDVLAALAAGLDSGRVQLAVATSLERGVSGFLIAIAIGTPIGLLLAEYGPLRRAVGPIVSGLQVLPSVAWVPAAILWFGLSDATVYFVILTGATPSIINGLVSGVDQVPPQLRRVGTVLGAGRVRLATSVVLPAALPGYFAGLKQGWAFSWRSLMAAEIIATGGSIGFGLGAMLDQSRQLSDIAGVFATILLILVIGIVIELLVFGPVERRMLRRRGLLPGASR